MNYMEDINYLRTTHAFQQFAVASLRTNKVKVIFEKTDGTKREMLATLKEGLAVFTESKTGKVKKENPEVCAVYDLEANGWRSFRWDKLIDFIVLHDQ